jgi:prepilin-type processing-associated H-X9-DG protein
LEGPEGLTYAFGDGHVILANTKQGVTLVAPR